MRWCPAPSPRRWRSRHEWHGLVIGKFYPPHAGHLALVRAALARCDRVTVLVLGSSQESIPADAPGAVAARRAARRRTSSRALDDEPVDYASETAWRAHTAIIEDLLDAPVDTLFSSDDYGEELARRLGATWVQVDPARRGTPVSARAVRADPAGYWWALPPAVRAWFVRRVVVIGAESTGTTTLAEALTRTSGCRRSRSSGASGRRSGPVASRRRGTPRSSTSSRASRRGSRTTPPRAPRCRCSSATPTCSPTAVWHERYVGRPSPSVAALAAARVPDLYLLTGDEIPFVQDGLRDGEHLRHAMQDRFREVLAAQDAPWVELRGTPDERLARALALVEPLRRRPRWLAEPMEQRHEVVPDLAAALSLPDSGA